VSVIIPTFNRLWALPDAVASCRRNDGATEIIVVDDGSTDGTWAWLESQPDIVKLRQPNWGKDWAVNRGLALSQGEFVRFLDSDDLLPPGANDRQAAIGRRERADVVVAGHICSDEQAGTSRVVAWVACDDFVAQQLGECDSSHYSAYLFRRDFIDGVPHRQEFGVRDDRMFVIEVAIARPRVAICQEPCLLHRQHGRDRLQALSGLREVSTNWSHLQIYRKAEALLTGRGELTPRRRRAMARALWPLAHWIARTHLGEAREVVDRIYRLDPDFRPPEAGPLGALYRHLGFAATECVLSVRRRLLAPLRVPARALIKTV
jgi:glycosyltransferase involved in cell wall biosynthesis